MTPTRDSALEMGCVCTTRLMPHTTAMAAKIMKRIASIELGEGHHEAGEEQVDHGDREHESPGEAHELVVTETRQRAADPDVDEQNEAGFRREPDDGHQRRRNRGNQNES